MIDAVIAPARLLIRHMSQWLPIVAVLAVFAALPEAMISYFGKDLLPLVTSSLAMGDLTLIFGSASLVVVLILFGFVIELLAYMLVFVILADISAGREVSLWEGSKRLASLRLQAAWLVAGVFEQIAISLWFIGGAVWMWPLGMVTTAAYEEESGFGAFKRSVDLGLHKDGPGFFDRPGLRIAVPITLAMAGGFAIRTVIELVSCVASAGAAAPALIKLLQTLQSGAIPTELPELPGGGPVDIVLTLFFAPLGLIPTVYMMAVQQTAYWQARQRAEALAEPAR
jgi:hypothetical protein